MPSNDDLFNLRDEFYSERDFTRREIDVLKRKARGISGANRRAAAIEITLSKVENRLEKLEAKANGTGVTPNVLFEMEQIQKDVTKYRGEIDGLDARVSVLEQSEANRINFQDSKIDVVHTSELKSQTPWVEALVMGIVAAFLAFVFLNLGLARSWDWVKDFCASVIIGVAVYWIVASFEKWTLDLKVQARHIWAWKDQHTSSNQAVDIDKAETREAVTT